MSKFLFCYVYIAWWVLYVMNVHTVICTGQKVQCI
jgi:hypothetical protein